MKKIVFLLLGAFALISCQQEKTAYVDNGMLMKNYKAMESAKTKLDTRQSRLQASMQAEGEKFQKEVEKYQKNLETMSKKEQNKRREELMKEQQQLRQKQQMQGSLMQKQSKKAQDSLRKVMDGKIADYAEAHNYTYIFGLTDGDNLLYAKDNKNITQDLLKELNAEHSDSSNEKSMKSDSTVTK